MGESTRQETECAFHTSGACGTLLKWALIILLVPAQLQIGLAAEVYPMATMFRMSPVQPRCEVVDDRPPAAAILSRISNVRPTLEDELKEQVYITTAAKDAEPQGRTQWEEPSLFPHDSVPQSNGALETQKTRAFNRENGDTIPTHRDESVELERKHSAGTFHAEFGNLGPSSPSPLGLASTRERDAILARIQDKESTEPYNIKIGRIPLRMAASFDAEFTDNSERTNHAPKSDLMLLPRLDVTGSVKLGSTTTLTIGLGIGYVKYLVRTEQDRMLTLASLNPDNGVSLDVKIGKFLISIYDKPVVPQFQADAVTQRNQSQYNQFTNTAGVNILWDVNSHTSMSVRYDHLDRIPLTSATNTSDGSTDSFLASLSCNLGQSLGVGIEAGAEVTKSTGALLNAGTTYHVGPVVNYELSRYLRFQASVGYQAGQYGRSGIVGDTSSLGTYYASVSLANNLNTRLSHSLSFGQESQQGSVSNFTISKYVRYQATCDLIRGVMIGASASFQDIDESGGLLAEHFRNISFGIYCGLNVTTHTSLSLAFNYVKRYVSDQSDLQGSSLDYDENRITLHLGYAF